MVNYKQSQKDKFDIRRCPEGTVFINKPKSLWELYSWQIIAGSIVLAVILGVFVVVIVFQHKRMAFIALRDKTVNNMPICYITGRVKLDAAGKVVGIDFTSGNYEAKELATKNTNNGDYHSFLIQHTLSNCWIICARLKETSNSLIICANGYLL